MFRVFALLYGTASYAVFLLAFLYAIGFVSGVAVPKHVDNGTPTALPLALAINLALLSLFAVQHSGMARPAFKRWFTRYVPASIERSTFVLASSLVLVLLYWQWRPLPALVWNVESEAARWLLHGLAALGWVLVLASTFLIDHFDLFGLRQTWRAALGRGPTPAAPFVTRALYRIVRHPIMLGFLIAFWATPTMTMGHLLFALVTTGYILVAVKYLEERDLVAQYGDTYRDYQRRVPMLLPWRRPRAGTQPVSARQPGSV
ncbi:protein-S-isoprenylcysteine O-methyltransferase Ste14 [Luteimonas cucumeris]|uniref:methanethiol S-methyltransferase n=1 Tax=Luteimonas cucumeris TaxID=985012 RepID=A0A562LE99_9GAMM|nr:methanethiol S-methyltransferase [Luteimonas cucumeris]TWI05963.1 protein-S-isoprenylcysteine O-methyltransferase Ste14 [Luteimonas cucumeris]